MRLSSLDWLIIGIGGPCVIIFLVVVIGEFIHAFTS